MKPVALAFSLMATTLSWSSSPVSARDIASGLYRAHAGPDAAILLEISADGRFRYQLAVGALDQWAEGRWEKEGTALRLYTEPTPRPPVFEIKSGPANAGDPLVQVKWPNGRGLAGVDVRVGFADGETADGYTQTDGWSPDAGEKRVPLWVELVEPINDVRSERFTLSPGEAVSAVLVPNDIGVMDFRGAKVVPVDGDDIELHYPTGEMRFSRVSAARD